MDLIYLIQDYMGKVLKVRNHSNKVETPQLYIKKWKHIFLDLYIYYYLLLYIKKWKHIFLWQLQFVETRNILQIRDKGCHLLVRTMKTEAEDSSGIVGYISGKYVQLNLTKVSRILLLSSPHYYCSKPFSSFEAHINVSYFSCSFTHRSWPSISSLSASNSRFAYP